MVIPENIKKLESELSQNYNTEVIGNDDGSEATLFWWSKSNIGRIYVAMQTIHNSKHAFLAGWLVENEVPPASIEYRCEFADPAVNNSSKALRDFINELEENYSVSSELTMQDDSGMFDNCAQTMHDLNKLGRFSPMSKLRRHEVFSMIAILEERKCQDDIHGIEPYTGAEDALKCLTKNIKDFEEVASQHDFESDECLTEATQIAAIGFKILQSVLYKRTQNRFPGWCGRICGECKTSCPTDEAIPCSPNCELLGSDGKPKNLAKCREAGCDAIESDE